MSTSMLCRVCVSEQSELVNMLNLYYGSTPATTFIMDILQIKVDSEGSSALVMCSSCNTTLNNFYSFYSMVRDAQHKYNQMINNTQVGASHKYITIHPMKGETVEVEFTVEDGSHTENIVKCKQEVCNEDNGPNCSVESLSEISNYQDDVNYESNAEEKTKSNKKQSKLFLRKQMATKAMLTKYKMGEMTDGKQWLLADDQIEEMLSLYVDMKCVHCAVPPFNTYTQLEKHCTKEHGTHPTVQCCHTSTLNHEDLKTHILYRHILRRDGPRKFKIVSCPVCKKSIRHTIMKEHLSIHLPHDKREFQCEECHTGFGTRAKLNAHISIHHSKLTVPCEDCGKTFKTKLHLKYHRNKVHSSSPDDTYLCPDCGKKIKYLSNYESHVREHQGIVERVKCHICDVVVKKGSFSAHMRSHDPKKQKQCPHCPYKAFNILEHVKRVHDKIKPFACTYCTMTFHKMKPMQDHIASRHTGIPAYACEFCNKTFMSSGNYHSHRKRMHPEQLAEMKLKIANKTDTNNIPDSLTLKKRKKTIVEGAEADLVIQNIQNRNKKPGAIPE